MICKSLMIVNSYIRTGTEPVRYQFLKNFKFKKNQKRYTNVFYIQHQHMCFTKEIIYPNLFSFSMNKFEYMKIDIFEDTLVNILTYVGSGSNYWPYRKSHYDLHSSILKY